MAPMSSDGPPNPASAFRLARGVLGFKTTGVDRLEPPRIGRIDPSPENPTDEFKREARKTSANRVKLQCGARVSQDTPRASAMDEEEDLASQLGPRTSQCVSRLARVSPPRDAPAGLGSIEGLARHPSRLSSLPRSRAATAENAERRRRRHRSNAPRALTETRVSPTPTPTPRTGQSAGHGRLALEARVRERKVRARDFAI